VALHHAPLWNLIDWHVRTLAGGVRTLQFASLNFDASFHEMFAAWATGGTVVIVADDVRASARELVAFIDEHAVEKVILPVVVLQQIAELSSEREDPLPHVREITTTGEQLQITEPVRALFARLRNARVVHNHYGPAETHVVTAYTQSGPPAQWPTYPPIGASLVNTGAYVLDPWFGPVPRGATGEMFLRGVALARGYYRRPDLTADRFLPDPFATTPGARMYRTGDLSRRPARDLAVHLGRKDHQIKIRGMRVELGEIENAISRHPFVHEVVVCALPDAGSLRLVAYVVPAAGRTITAPEVRRHLQPVLPDHMIPSAVVTLDALPLTPNGKVDRRALPAPGVSRTDADADTGATTALEQVIAGVWARLLHVERVGPNDNFFQLGGHSMLGARMIAELSRIFQVELPLRHLFQAPTVAELAERIVRAVGSAELCEEIAATCLEVEQELNA
jgi:acyl-coenzyme A synthetase/AMP-(fatty) acid ligase